MTKIVQNSGSQDDQSLVRVFTEWAPLEEVILGSSRMFNHDDIDLTFQFLYNNADGRFAERNITPKIDLRYIEERQQDLNDLEALLRAEGITVRRPQRLDKVRPILTPHFSTSTTASDSPRDMFFAYGTSVIETPPTNRKRFFEQALLRDVFRCYFDSGASWIAAPRPLLSDSSMDFSYWKDGLDDEIREPTDVPHQFDIAFDAANILKFGNDLVMNVGTGNHEIGAAWLARQLPESTRLHVVRLCDSHIDGHLMPIAPGRLLCNEGVMHGQYDRLPEALQRWDRIPIMDSGTNFEYPSDHLQMASNVGMSVNVLSLDEERILIRDTAVLTIRALERAGFTPIPVRIRHCELFGGGIHCSTVDVRRTESCESYFE